METYEHITMVNRYLYGQLEACTAMITFLESKGLVPSELKETRFRLKKDIERNLEKLDYALDINELNNK